jgi:MFS family permease
MTKKPLLKITLLLSAMMTMMAGAVVAPSLEQINSVFSHVNHIDYLSRLVITLPALFIAFFSPIYGKLIDKTGRKKWLIFALIIYAIGGTSGFFLNNIYYILIGRALLGIAVAGIMTVATTLVGDYFKGPERGSFFGLQGAFIGIGGVVFISISGLLADVNWQMPFLIYLFSIPVLIMVVLFLYEPKMESIDSSKTEKLNNSDINIKLLAIIFTTIFLAIVCFYMVPVQLPFMLKEINGVSYAMVGYAISVSTLFSAIVSINYKHIKARLSFSEVYILSFILMGIGYFFISKSVEYHHYIMSIAFSGMGVGLLMPTGALWVITIAPPHLRGQLISGVSTSMFLGMFFSPIIVQPLVNNIQFKGAFASASILLIVMALFFLIFRNRLPN